MALEKMRLTEYSQRLYLHLSGGERQLVLIARALLIKNGRVMADGPAREVVHTDSICALYNMPRELMMEAVHYSYERL